MRRATVLAAAAVLAVQATLGSLAPIAAPVQAAEAQAPAAPVSAAMAATAAGACTVTSGPTGGLLSACPAGASYADVAAGLQVAMDGLRAGAETGSLQVTSSPAGATVSINGVDSGVTPLDLPLPPGTYLVRISADGYTPFSHVIAVASGAPTVVSKTLDRGDSSNAGSSQLLKPDAIIAQLGPSGYPNGSFAVSGYVRDKDGADYVSFINGGATTMTFPRPDDYSGFAPWVPEETAGTNTAGIAKSTDDGATWTVVKAWPDTYTSSVTPSPRFSDSQWSSGDPGPVSSHWLRVAYHRYHWEQFSVSAMVPRTDGGITVYLSKTVLDQPQEVINQWDNLPARYCRPDDSGPQCIGIDHPARYWGTPFTVAGTGAVKTVASPQVVARWGMRAEDLATYLQTKTSDVEAFATSTGAQTSVSSEPFIMGYQGSHTDTDYFLALDAYTGNNGDGHVYTARGGAFPALQTTYNLGADAPKGSARAESLLLGPDGTVFVLDHNRGRVYRLEGSTPVLVGSVPPDVYGGLIGAMPSQYNYLSAAVDSAGNVHAAFRVGVTPPGMNMPMTISDYYQLFPAQKPAYDAVALFTQPGCTACDAARVWLTAAGVTFRENPGDLPADVAGSVGAAASAKGYPVVARLGGGDGAVIGGADVAAISALLGVSYPILVDTHPSGGAPTAATATPQVYADWVLLLLDGDQPRVIAPTADGVMAFQPSGAGWTPVKLLSAASSGGGSASLSLSYPLFPGGLTTASLAVQHTVPHNTFAKVADLRFVQVQPNPSGSAQQTYALYSTKAAPSSEGYRVVEAVSQLIPAAAFYVALGPSGSVSPVEGELAPYVTSQGVVTSNGYRFAKIVVDLRAQNETARNGNIPSRTIGGAVSVAAKAADGSDETRAVSLILLVQNTRLRTYDANSRAASLDITSEALHFSGANEHWVVTNNTALPDTVVCRGGTTISLPPNATTSLPAATVLDKGLGDCLASLEVPPSVLDGCSSWDDAQLVLAAQTMDSLAASLPLVRAESVTNWELAYGSRSASVYRLVSLDSVAGTPGAPACATAVSGKSAAVVRITGAFLGSGEAYAPAVTVVDAGSLPVQTAATAQPGTLAFEREWLAFEATFLQASLGVAAADEAFASLMTLNRGMKRYTYQRHLLAVEALLSCNYDGVSIFSVQDLMLRTSLMPDELRGTVVCLNNFALDPRRHWPEYNARLWASSDVGVTYLGTLIDSGLAANPTLSWLAAAARGTAPDYGTWVADHAKGLAAKAAEVDLIGPATDFELDDYGRIATAASRDLGGLTGPVLRAATMAGPLERSELKVVLECVSSMTGASPLEHLITLTSTRAYTGGIPCVDARTGGQAQQDRYQMLALGLRSGTFSALWEAAGRDLDLVGANLRLMASAIDQVATAEGRWPEGTTIASYAAKLPALDRMEIALRAMGATVAKRGQQASVRDVLRGVTECGIGLAKSLPEAVVVIGAAGAAEFASPVAGAIGGLIFLGFGTSVTYLSAKDLAFQWTSLDQTAKTAGVCGMAVNALFAVKGAVDAPFLAYRGYRSWTAAAVRAAPPKTIDIKTIQSRGMANGLSLEEQGAITAPLGDTVAEPAAVAPPALDPALETVISALADGPQQATARAVAEQLGYAQMTPFEQMVVQKMLGTTGSRALTRTNGAGAFGFNTPEYKAWQDVGSAVISALEQHRPKSVSAQPQPAVTAAAGEPAKPVRLSGDDAAVQKAADNAAAVQPGGAAPPAGTPERAAYDATMLSRQPFLLEAVLGSERLAQALRDPSVRRLYAPEEAADLLTRAHAANPDTIPAFYGELSSPRFLDTLRAAVTSAQDAAGLSGQAVAAVESTLFSPGKSKVAARLTVHLDGGRSVDVVVAKGNIGAKEAALYAKLGPEGITPRLLAPLLENADGAQAVMTTEFAPSSAGTLPERVMASLEEPYAAAIGALDARIWFKTQEPVTLPDGTTVVKATYDTDLHLGNINVDTSVSPASARAVDFDPTYQSAQGEVSYWLTNLFRRNGYSADGAQAAQNFNGYLDGIVAGYEAETGAPAGAYDLLRRLEPLAASPAGQAQAAALQPSVGSGAVLAELGAGVAADIHAYLAAKGQTLPPPP